MTNLLLVTADSVRADYCGYLTGGETTPFLSEFSSECVVFENAVAPGPRTPSSVPVSLTGERFRTNDAETNQGRLERIADHIDRFDTAPEMLAADGYSTGAVTANPWTTGTTGFDELFDEFVEVGTGHGDAESRDSTIGQLTDYVNQWRKNTDWFAQWPSLYDEIQRLVDELPEPWFIWVFLLDPHSPYIVPRADRTESNVLSMYYSAARYNLEVMRTGTSHDVSDHLDRYLQETYRDAIRSVDRFLSRIVDDIPSSTSIVFHSDHGEAFGENGTYGHQEELYSENIHVPLLVYDGDTNGRVDAPASGRHVPSMLVDLSENSFTPETYAQPAAYSSTEFGDSRAVRTDTHTAIVSDDSVKAFALRDGQETPADDPDTEQVFRELVESEFARDAERERIVSAVSQADL